MTVPFYFFSEEETIEILLSYLISLPEVEKKYRKAKYVQHRVRFVNVQSSLRLFCLCTHVQCRVCYIYHVEFHFRFRGLLSFPVKHQLGSGCHGEKSSKKISGNFSRGGEGGNVFEDRPIFEVVFNF